MKVVVDGHMINDSGIGRYTRSLIRKLLNDQRIMRVTLVGSLPNDAIMLDAFMNSPKFNYIPYHASVYSIKHQILGSFIFLRLSKQNDHFYFPHYDVPLLIPKRSSITIHDLIQFNLPQYFHWAKRALAWLKIWQCLLFSEEIITDSKTTKSDLIKCFSVNPNKIYVRYIEVEEKFKILPKTAVEEFNASHQLGRYFLCVGNVKPHKNLSTAISSFRELKKSHPDIKLVIIGKKGKPPKNTNNFDMYKNNIDIIYTGEISDDELITYYNGATAFLFLSLYEGYGLPPLEAMSCGIPVIASNRSSIPEVLGDAAYFVNPEKINEIVQAMQIILFNQDERKKFIQKGLARVKIINKLASGVT